jgi:hypothetical protein
MSQPSDLDAIAAVLVVGVAMCGDCIARMVSAPLWRVHNDLAQLPRL